MVSKFGTRWKEPGDQRDLKHKFHEVREYFLLTTVSLSPKTMPGI